MAYFLTLNYWKTNHPMKPEQLLTTDKTRPFSYSSALEKKLSLLAKTEFTQVIKDFWSTQNFTIQINTQNLKCMPQSIARK